MNQLYLYSKINSINSRSVSEFCSKHEFIYRYIILDRFLEMMSKKSMAFVNPSKWHDPFDKFLFKQAENIPNSFLHKMYVMCVTLTPHSQAYWKEYAPNGYAVRIKMKTKDFFDRVLKAKKDCWFGRLNYLPEKQLIAKLNNTAGLKNSLQSSTINSTFLEAFSYKRLPYKYENEVRFIIPSDKKLISGIKWIPFEPNDVIRDIYLDPRMGKYETTMVKNYLSAFEINVRKSQLFKDKKITIQ